MAKNYFKATSSGSVAKERLRLMMGTAHEKLDEDTLDLIRQDISAAVTKYVDVEPENIEIKVRLRDFKKRA